MKPTQTPFFHVDVFARRALAGNGLAVFLDTDGWSDRRMQELTREMLQMESIFLSKIDANGATARIFTIQGELPYAGHPVLGAAAILHRTLAPNLDDGRWRLRLPLRSVHVTTRRHGLAMFTEMDQGAPVFGPPIAAADASAVLQALNLDPSDLVVDLPLQRVSTGLPYLIVPVTAEALALATVRGRDLESQLAAFDARFAYLLDPDTPEGRTWDNLGEAEDVATGSAAGPVAAYLHRYGRFPASRAATLQQGRYAGRPSELGMRFVGDRVFVSGEVWPLISGVLELSPEAI
jgi:trans-2,3-dihydro-3-hydroxyanthranilate isomerase